MTKTIGIKELFEEQSKQDDILCENKEKLKEAIYNILLDTLLSIDGNSFGYHVVDETEELKKDFNVWVGENEFTINQEFGHIDLNEINIINDQFKVFGYYLKSISDTQTKSDKKGLYLYFVEIEGD